MTFILVTKKVRVEINTLYWVFYDFQKQNKGFIELKKQIQCNKPSFCFLIRL